MVDAIETLRKALGLESTWQFVAATAVVGALIFGVLAWVVDRAHKNSITVQTSTPTQNVSGLLNAVPPAAEQPNSKSKPQKNIATHPRNAATNPVGSIVNQDSPNYGTQVVNNIPPSRVISDDKLPLFTAALKAANSGMLHVLLASSADDAFPLSQQICAAAEQAQWGKLCPTARDSVVGGDIVADGLHCYAVDWEAPDAAAVKAAMKAVSLPCIYHSAAYSANGVQFGGGVTIVIGSPRQT